MTINMDNQKIQGFKPITVSFIGDISLNDKYNELYQQGERPFAAVGDLLGASDLVVGNLECMAKGKKGENTLKKPRLKTDPDTLNYLTDINLGLACLANNHVYDNLEDGFDTTVSSLHELGIDYTGASVSSKPLEPFIFCKNGIKIAILNYVTIDTNPNIPTGAGVVPNWFSLEKVIRDIHSVRCHVNHVVICPHWGGLMEGSCYPEPDLISIAHKLIDAGADLIVGHHSHTLQPMEIYRSKSIFYSLGNFCFSDIVSDGKNIELDTKRSSISIVLRVNFNLSCYEIDYNFISNNHNRIYLEHNPRRWKLPVLSNSMILYRYACIWKLYVYYEKNVYPVISLLFFRGKTPVNQIMSVSPKSALKHIRRMFG